MFRKIFIVFFIFSLISCTSEVRNMNSQEKILSGLLVQETTAEPLVNVKIELYRQTKPLLAMRGWEKIDETNTDEVGQFKFSIYKNGDYSIRWNPDNNFLENDKYVKNFVGKKKIMVIHSDQYGKNSPLRE